MLLYKIIDHNLPLLIHKQHLIEDFPRLLHVLFDEVAGGEAEVGFHAVDGVEV